MNEKKIVAATTAATMIFAGTAYYLCNEEEEENPNKFDSPRNFTHTSCVWPTRVRTYEAATAGTAAGAAATVRSLAGQGVDAAKINGAVGHVRSGFGSAGVRSAVS